jgi:cytochrome c-type biogenesis protein
MINDIFTLLNSALAGNAFLSIVASFGWGVLSILLSPCHLTSIPLIIGFINSKSEVTVKRTFILSLFFSLGILITIALIGIITASFGKMLGNLGSVGNYVVAVVFFAIGLYLLDIITFPAKWIGTGTKFKTSNRIGIISAFTIGLLFGIGLGPCTFAFMAPVLGVVFNISATNLSFAVLLLIAFAAGHCTVIVFAGTLTVKVQQFLNWSEGSKAIIYIKKICGLLVIAGGIYLIYSVS